MDNGSDFFQMEENRKIHSDFSLAEEEGTKVKNEQMPEFDEYGTALNEL